MALDLSERMRKKTEHLLDDYRRNPPPGRTPAQIEAYCEGFLEATLLSSSAIALHLLNR